jgi:hypothetical protein
MADLKTVTLTLDPQQLSAVFRGLDELPGKDSRVIYGALLKQAQDQVTAAAAPPPSAVAVEQSGVEGNK